MIRGSLLGTYPPPLLESLAFAGFRLWGGAPGREGIAFRPGAAVCYRVRGCAGLGGLTRRRRTLRAVVMPSSASPRATPAPADASPHANPGSSWICTTGAAGCTRLVGG